MFHVKHEPIQSLPDFTPSPEVISRLKTFAALLTIWNRRINLVSRRNLENLWPRHIADSLQLIPLMPENPSDAVDLGSGAGFPGLILSIATSVPFSLIESDHRKAAFLIEAARVTAAPIRVHATRIQETRLPQARLVTARALAPLPDLLALAAPFLTQDGICLFPKGGSVGNELTEAAAQWHMRAERFQSRSDPSASLLRISEIRRVRASP
ncbi:MAG TPA: 16S rRNA (guanine(527)-N(7))-methyltransferase RsmG [Acetobacteraceae bacterium]|nr:16S rRNA (guanine(527)-N(7))-methyltransferase RsmG [Acetobacteraceae bacterium]